jgi:hypothetical protein
MRTEPGVSGSKVKLTKATSPVPGTRTSSSTSVEARRGRRARPRRPDEGVPGRSATRGTRPSRRGPPRDAPRRVRAVRAGGRGGRPGRRPRSFAPAPADAAVTSGARWGSVGVAPVGGAPRRGGIAGVQRGRALLQSRPGGGEQLPLEVVGDERARRRQHLVERRDRALRSLRVGVGRRLRGVADEPGEQIDGVLGGRPHGGVVPAGEVEELGQGTPASSSARPARTASTSVSE